MRHGLLAVCLAVAGVLGCIEMQMLLGPPPPDTTPVFDFEDEGGEDVGTTGVEDADTDGQEDADTDETEDADTNGAEDDPVVAINRGEVGDIPAIPEDAEETVTESGLRMFDVTVGTGAPPQPDSQVIVNYTGWLAEDGTEFDSGDGVEFNLQGLIQGWQEGISTMLAGGSRRMIIPPELGYGEAGSGPNIPPNATLVFDIDLLVIP